MRKMMELKQFGFTIEFTEEELQDDRTVQAIRREGETAFDAYMRFFSDIKSGFESGSLLPDVD
jgi:hypothetical protein